MNSNNYFQGFFLNVSPLCQGCSLIMFAHQNDIMFHECELCKNKYQEMLAQKEYKEQINWGYHTYENHTEDNMTVKELIEKLQEMPQDLLVVDCGCFHVEGCHIEEEFYDGDAANPRCPVLTVVMID